MRSERTEITTENMTNCSRCLAVTKLKIQSFFIHKSVLIARVHTRELLRYIMPR